MADDREPMSLEALGGFLPAFTAIAGGYGFLDAADALHRLSRANELLEAPIPVIAVALALPPHDPEADELVRAYADADPDATPPAGEFDGMENDQTPILRAEISESWVKLSLYWPPYIAESIARGTVPRPAIWYRAKGDRLWRRHCSARPVEHLPAFGWAGVASGTRVDFAIASFDTDADAPLMANVSVVRP